MSINYATADPWSSGIRINKRGATGNANAAIANGTELGYHGFYGWNGSAFGRSAMVYAASEQNFSAGNHGGRLSFYTTPIGAGDVSERLRIAANGHITAFAQPVWSSDIGSGTNIYSTFSISVNVGFTQTNSSTITVQTAGKYYVRAQQLLQTAGGGYWELRKNNATVKHAYASGSTFMDYNVGALLDLAAGDTIRIFTNITLTNSWNGPHSSLDIIKVA
jgi:hypothetical protein